MRKKAIFLMVSGLLVLPIGAKAQDKCYVMPNGQDVCQFAQVMRNVTLQHLPISTGAHFEVIMVTSDQNRLILTSRPKHKRDQADALDFFGDMGKVLTQAGAQAVCAGADARLFLQSGGEVEYVFVDHAGETHFSDVVTSC